jgi:anti-anti-sigma factor
MTDDGVVRLPLAGEIDVETVDTLKASIDAAVDGGARSIEFDLADVTFLDSAGLALFAQAALRLPDGVSLSNASDLVRRVVEVTGLTEILHLR